MSIAARKGIRAAQLGILVNSALAVTKLIAGVAGNSYALVADAIESATDIVSSLILMSGLWISQREPTEDYPFGFGRAETLAAATMALMLIGAAIGIGIQAVREILTPHHLPEPWTLGILVGVIAIKWLTSRSVGSVGAEIGSTAVRADAWHHLSDAVTSAAAFIGISIALWGGRGWEPADDWAALVCSLVIAYNGGVILKETVRDLMDAAPESDVEQKIREVGARVPGVLAVEKIFVRRSGLVYHAAVHVQAVGSLTLSESHALGGRFKAELRQAVPQMATIIVHMEPFGG